MLNGGSLSRVAGENVGVYGINQGDLALNSGNYDLSYQGNNLTITKALLNVIADAKTKVYGDADPSLTYQVSGLKNGDRNGYSQCTQFLHRVHELAIAFYPAVLEFEGMDVVVLAIALRIPRDQRLAAPVALDPEVVRILGLEDPHVVPLPVGEAALEPLGEPPEALMAPESSSPCCP